jgi:hypothetical protein
MKNFQGWLDRGSRAFLADDFDTYAGLFDSPFMLITTTASMVAAVPEDLREAFHQFHAMLKSQGTTDMVRLAYDVRPVGSALLVGWYETHFLRGGTRVFDPFVSNLTLRFSGGEWRAACITNVMTNRDWPIFLPRFDRGAPAEP